MDPNLALAGLIIAVALFNRWQTRIIARQLALTVETATKAQNDKLEAIYKVADGRFSEALQTIEDLKGLLVQGLDAQDPRVREAIGRNS